MSKPRILAAVAVSLAVAALLAFQVVRERAAADCAAKGGTWDGAASNCRPGRRPILERDGLKRS